MRHPDGQEKIVPEPGAKLSRTSEWGQIETEGHDIGCKRGGRKGQRSMARAGGKSEGMVM